MSVLDDSKRRDMIAGQARVARSMIDLVRRWATGDSVWDEPMTDAEAVVANCEAAMEALTRVETQLVGDLSEQAERWLEEPGQRMTMQAAVKAAGVGGTVRRYLGGPTSLSKQFLDYQVVRINECSARLRDMGTLDEERIPFGRWDYLNDVYDKQWVVMT
jgi:hypothetical protein